MREVVRFLNFLLRHCEIPPAESWQSINQRSYKWLQWNRKRNSKL
ncbi:hypothetical protein [Helicobacter sp.]|nr:hypothetical protein [Helicobacter sp.]MDY5557367.1 hypothetical protein [Helicobacter sp.]